MLTLSDGDSFLTDGSRPTEGPEGSSMTLLSEVTITDAPEAKRPGETWVQCVLRVWWEHDTRKWTKKLAKNVAVQA